jgi:hypothetical protein
MQGLVWASSTEKGKKKAVSFGRKYSFLMGMMS